MGANKNQKPPDFLDETNGIEKDFSRDLIFHLLRNKRRRAVMFYLSVIDDEVTMRDLSQQVAAWEHNMDVDALPGSKRETTHVSLYQTHLPTLDEHNIVVFEKHNGVIKTGDNLDVFKQYLETDINQNTGDGESEENIDTDEETVVQDLEWLHKEPSIEGTSWKTTALRVLTPPVDKNIKWSRYYLGCSVIGTGLIVSAVTISEQTDTALLVASLIMLAILTVLSFAHVFYEASPEDVARVEKLILGKSYRK